MAPRLLALVAAVAMVVGSIALRARLDDEDAGGGSGGDGDGRGRPRLVCSTEVAAACEAVRDQADVTTEAAGTTLERLVKLDDGADAELDGWLVAGPWPQMVDEQRRVDGRGSLLDADAPLARSPIVIAVWPERAGALRKDRCKPDVTWKCLGEVAGTPWSELATPYPGPVRPGYGDAAAEATGLAIVASAAVSYFGSTDFGSGEFEDPGFGAWFSRLDDATQHPRTISPLSTMLTRRRAEYDAVGTVEAEAGPLVGSAAEKPLLIYPEPKATADVVLGTPRTQRKGTDKLVAPLQDALLKTGWRVDSRMPEGADPAFQLPPSSGLPSPGVLLALRNEVLSR